jgi:hypothetical protein
MGIHVEVTLTPTEQYPDGVGAKMVVEDDAGYEMQHLGQCLAQLVNGVAQFLPPGEAVSSFLGQLHPDLQVDMRPENCEAPSGQADLARRLDTLRRARLRLDSDLQAMTDSRNALSAQVADLQMARAERELQSGNDRQFTEASVARVVRERDNLRTERDNLRTERDNLRTERDKLKGTIANQDITLVGQATGRWPSTVVPHAG